MDALKCLNFWLGFILINMSPGWKHFSFLALRIAPYPLKTDEEPLFNQISMIYFFIQLCILINSNKHFIWLGIVLRFVFSHRVFCTYDVFGIVSIAVTRILDHTTNYLGRRRNIRWNQITRKTIKIMVICFYWLILSNEGLVEDRSLKLVRIRLK